MGVEVEVTFYMEKTILSFLPGECGVRAKQGEGGRGEGRGQFCYTESKSQQLLLLACVVFLRVKGGPVLLSLSEDVTMAGC